MHRKSLLQRLLAHIQPAKKTMQGHENNNTTNNHDNAQSHYFETAQNWADDAFAAVLVSRNRYQFAFLFMAILVGLLALSTATLTPLQHTQLVVVHEGEGLNGEVWLSAPPSHSVPPLNWARTQSEIAHYVEVRESYDPLLYAELASEVAALSNAKVQSEYDAAQASHNPNSPITQLGTKGYQSVIVHSVLPLDSADETSQPGTTHINLAQVDFDVVTHTIGEDETQTAPYTALIAWTYQGVPSDPSLLLQNWDGFTVTQFDVQPVAVGN